MLQQTTVTAVIPYFKRFVAALPDVCALAAADEQYVLKLWEGLGYYRRARHLHAAAKELVRLHGGQLPDDPAVWSALPGVGRYILGAVLSQAFDRRLPIVEANSLRVLSRLFAYRGDPRTGPGKMWVWSAAEQLLPARRVGDFNQALMELGALVCTPTHPNCGQCPLAAQCAARKLNWQEHIPPKPMRPEPIAVHEVGVVIWDDDRVLLCKRPADAGRWPNMWEVPHAAHTVDESLSQAATRVARELTGFTVKIGQQLITIKHAVTRYAITLVCVEAVPTDGQFTPGAYTEARWTLPAELAAYPVSAPQRQLMTALANSNRQWRLF